MKNRVLLASLLALVALVAGNCWIRWGTNPLLLVQEHAGRMGWEADSLTLLEGGYHSSLLALHAYGLYRPRDPGRGREVYIELARPGPLLDWRLVEYRVAE